MVSLDSYCYVHLSSRLFWSIRSMKVCECVHTMHTWHTHTHTKSHTVKVHQIAWTASGPTDPVSAENPTAKVTWLSHSETSTEPTNNSTADTCAPCGRDWQKAVFTTTGSIQWGSHSSEGEEVVVVVVVGCLPPLILAGVEWRREVGGGRCEHE